jgi:hypothetical protein
MKTILQLLLALSVITVYGQTDPNEKKEKSRIATCKLKSVTQTAYQYKFNLQTKSVQPEATGTIVGKSTYDQKGNTIEQYSYNDNGNLDTKTTYKYDSKGHPIELIVTGLDGIVQGKQQITYNGDTILGIKNLNPGGTVTSSNFTFMGTERNPDGSTKFNLLSYSVADSLLVGSVKSTYDPQGNLIDYAEYADRYLTYREVYSYNAQGWKIKLESYDKNNELYAIQNYKYDEKGQMIEMESYGALGFLVSKVVYTSDGKGNFVKAIYYDAKGNPQMMYKYIYQKYE